jgi:hypothetical protein
MQQDGCMVKPVAYNIAVLRDGSPVEKRKSRRTIEEDNEENGNSKRI